MKTPAILIPLIVLLATACGGGGGSSTTDSTSGSSGSGSGSGGTSGGGNGGGNGGGTAVTLEKKAAALAAKLGKSSRFLIGLGSTSVTDIQKQSIRVDIYDQYLNGVGAGSWTTWNNPAGAYVQVVAKNADTLGAVPMFTLYQMASNGDGNLSGLTSQSFMSAYWNNVRLLFQQIAAYGKPVLVNVEPDFWGYAQRQSQNADPATVRALVSFDSDCSTQPDNVTGVAQCLLQIARKYAPNNAFVGFPPAQFADLNSTALGFMQKLGADKADFIVMQTLDRDAGCFEASPRPSYCQRNGSGWYWDATNKTLPNFTDHFAMTKSYHTGLQLPVIWWQTPLGVPSSTPGGVAGRYRDNRASYFLTHTAEMVAAGGLGVVFSTGEVNQTSINTDGGQFKTLSTNYLASPTALP